MQLVGARHRDVRHAEEPADRAGRGGREVRRRPGPGDRRAGAGRRFGRQRARRARHRHQDRGAADPGIRRPRHAAGARRRDQAAEAARGAARPRRADPHLAGAGHAEARRAARGAAGGARGARAGRRRRCSASWARWSSAPSPAGWRRSSGSAAPVIEPISGGGAGPGDGRRRASRPPVPPIDHGRYVILRDAAALADWVARDPRRAAWWRSTPRPRAADEMRAELVGIGALHRAGRGGLPAARRMSQARAASSTSGSRGRCRSRRRWRCCGRCSRTRRS